MQCARCGKDNPNGAAFCNGCGLPTTVPTVQPILNTDQRSSLKTLAAIGAAILFVALLWSIAGIPGSQNSDATSLQSTTTPQITLSKYNQLQDGMTYSEVANILGKPGIEISSSSVAGIKTVMIQWEADGFANMNAMFQNGKLVSKAQFGLK